MDHRQREDIDVPESLVHAHNPTKFQMLPYLRTHLHTPAIGTTYYLLHSLLPGCYIYIGDVVTRQANS